MLMELDYETVSALESALIVAEDSKMRDAKDWANIAESLGASPSPWGHRNSAGRRIIWRRFAGDRLTATVRPWMPYRGQKKAPVARTQRPGPNMKTPVL